MNAAQPFVAALPTAFEPKGQHAKVVAQGREEKRRMRAGLPRALADAFLLRARTKTMPLNKNYDLFVWGHSSFASGCVASIQEKNFL